MEYRFSVLWCSAHHLNVAYGDYSAERFSRLGTKITYVDTNVIMVPAQGVQVKEDSGYNSDDSEKNEVKKRTSGK